MSGTGPAVTIAGGGLSGLTAAMRLAERGYQITLYEQKSWLGGNLGSRPMDDGEYLDVYPHMYLDWYANFWALLESATKQPKEARFMPFSSVKQLSKKAFPKFASLTDMYSPWHMIQNMFSGIGPPADMFVFGYASIDLLAEKYNPTISLDNVDVNAFLNTRPYMTQAASDAFDSFITRVWAIPSYLASAPDFRRYLEYSILRPDPAFWLPTASAFTQVIDPLVKALEALGVNIVTNTAITGVSCARKRVTEIGLRTTSYDHATGMWVPVPGSDRTEKVANLLLAVPAGTLSTLVRTPVTAGDQTVVEEAPDIAGIVRSTGDAGAHHLPVLHPQVGGRPQGAGRAVWARSSASPSPTSPRHGPTCPRSRAGPSWPCPRRTPSALPGTTTYADAQAILLELAEYLPFRPGTRWGESPDIDWEHTRYEANADSQLFINQTGTDAWRPDASSSHISNIYLAGDFCNNNIGMTTIESAVTAGLEAAKVIVHRNRHGHPVTIIPPERNILADLGYVWLRYAWAPSAAAASLWSHALSFLKDGCGHRRRSGLPWLADPRGGVPGLKWIKRPGGGGSAPRERADLIHEGQERFGPGCELGGLGPRGVGDAVQHRLGLVELSEAGVGQRGQPLGIVVVDLEQVAHPGVADRQRGRQGEDAVADVLLAAAAQGLQATLVPDVVAAVVQDAEEVPVLAQPLRACAQHRADLEHRTGVLAGYALPVLDAEGLAPQPPLQALGRAQPPQQLGEVGDRERVIGERGEGVGHEVAGGHERGEPAEALLHGGDAAALGRAVEHVVDDQRHVVHQFHGEGQLYGVGRGRVVDGAITCEQGERPEVLWRPRQRPGEGVAQLGIDLLEPGGDPLPELGDVRGRVQLGDHVVAGDLARRHDFTR